MLRRLFTLASALSLLLCVATCGLWTRSYRRADSLRWPTINANVDFDSASGHLMFSWTIVRLGTNTHTDLNRGLQYNSTSSPEDQETFWPERIRAGFGIGTDEGQWFTARRCLVPFWALAVAFGFLPTIAIIHRKSPWAPHGSHICRHCGYDLRATPDRCPECGTVPSVAKVRV